MRMRQRILLLLLPLMTSTIAVADDPMGFQDSKWGMSVSDVVTSFEGTKAEKPLSKRKIRKIIKKADDSPRVGARFKKYRIDKFNYDISFYFSVNPGTAELGGLVKVVLSADWFEPQNIYASVYPLLIQRFGTPTLTGECGSGTTKCGGAASFSTNSALSKIPAGQAMSASDSVAAAYWEFEGTTILAYYRKGVDRTGFDTFPVRIVYQDRAIEGDAEEASKL